MESFKQISITTKTGKKKLQKQNKQQCHVSYFDTYQSTSFDNQTLCLIYDDHIIEDKYWKNVINRVQACSKCFGDVNCHGEWRMYQEKCEVFADDRSVLGLIYYRVCLKRTVDKLWQKLSQSEILDLAIVLVKMVCKIKENNVYFGSFFPDRICHIENQGFYVYGGDFFSPSCTSGQFLLKNAQIKPQISSKYRYQPPQMYNQKLMLKYSSDMFVVGCILYELITGQYPYNSKQELIQGTLPQKHDYSQLTKQICKRILQKQACNRIQPQQLLCMLEVQKSKAIFTTQKLTPSSTLPQIPPNKNSIFNNFQQFFLKCTTQTQGWFLYYCENTSTKSDEKYMQQILNKITKKNQKIHKLMNLIEKFACKAFKRDGAMGEQEQEQEGEDWTFSLIKMGVFLFGVLRKVPVHVQQFYEGFTKVCAKIVTQQPSNMLLSILYKVIGFKISLATKFPELRGNFYTNIQTYQKLSIQHLQYLSQYCLKLSNYLITHTNQSPTLTPCQSTTITLLCDQLYNSTSILLITLLSMKKDKKLKMSHRQQIKQTQFKKIDNECKQIINCIGKLCSDCSLFTQHQIYGICCYYQYQEELCLLYQPVVTSFQYFFVDRIQYKGLAIPVNYATIYYQCEEFQDFCQDKKFVNRKPMLHRASTIKVNENQDKKKATTNSHKLNVNFDKSQMEVQQNMKSQGSNVKSPQIKQPTKPKTQKKLPQPTQIQVSEFQAFLTTVQTPKSVPQSPPPPKSSTFKSSHPSSSNNSMPTTMSSVAGLQNKNNESNPTCEQSWFEADEHDIFSYEWLKRTQKIISKHFQKPQLDPIIYVVYEDLCQGLKLHELIAMLKKNMKVIVDPNLVLFQKVIGSGSAGDVYIGKYQQKIVAIKKVKTTSNPNALKQFERQVLTYIKIKSHPCLVSLVGLTKFNQDYFLLTQFCQGGSLFDLLHKKVNQITLSWGERIAIALDISKGMEFLHFMNPPVIHRDLKSLNVFMTKNNNNWAAKVADFGLSRSPDADMMTSALGTLHWMAPQLLCNKQYSLKVDVYSFAIVLWQICTRRTPYHNIQNQMGIVKHVALEKGRPLLQLINQGCPKQLVELMKKCWSEQPEQRPYFPQIIAQISKIKL